LASAGAKVRTATTAAAKNDFINDMETLPFNNTYLTGAQGLPGSGFAHGSKMPVSELIIPPVHRNGQPYSVKIHSK